ncbi:MAG: hypothetical protein KDB01_22655, partial [Planctomycetaceae bacterium]|nr:hypothetical protein [Planctomycetaceae bacterium]
MLKQLLNRIWKNSDCRYKSNRRSRWPANWNGIAANCAEMLESRQLLTLFVIDTLTDNADDANGISDGLLSLREAITASNSNAAFGDAPAGAADGDLIVFRDDLAGGTLTIGSGEFGISDDLSILTGGASSLTIDAGGLSRIFNIDTTGFNGSNHNVLISGLSLINGESLNNGGAVRIADSAHVSLSQMTISSSHAAESGGGVYAGNGVLNVAGVTLNSNSASGNLASQGGGAIFNNGGTLTIDGTSSLVTISNNTADGTAGSGGGIFSIGGAVTVTSANLTFNAANRAGGGIEVVDGTVSLTDVNLINNDAGSAAPAPGNGGGLHVTGSADVMVSGGSVFGNIASREGGGLWNSTGTMTISNGTLIQGNAASGDAADDGGGGIFNNGGTVIVDGSLAAVVITSNYADGVLGSGGGIFNNMGSVTVMHSEITANEAERAGGGIEDRNSVGTAIALTDVILDDNIVLGTDVTAPGNGGGLHVTGSGDVLISGGTVSGNIAALEGGGLWNGLGIMTINNGAVIDSNTASGVAPDDGGGGIFNNGGTLTIDGTSSLVTISNNTADGTAGSGGGIFSIGGAVTVTSANLTFNAANRAGGGIEVVDGTVSLRNVNLINNDAGSAAPAPGNGG